MSEIPGKDGTKQPIHCQQTHKLLARKSEQGIYLHCKECKTEHLFTWEELRLPQKTH